MCLGLVPKTDPILVKLSLHEDVFELNEPISVFLSLLLSEN